MIIKINYDKSTKQIVVSNDVKQIVLSVTDSTIIDTNDELAFEIAVNTTEYSTTSSSYSDITGLTLDITPSATSSKVLIMMQMTNRVANGGANTARGTVKLLRDSTDLQEMSYFAQLSIGNGNPDSLIHSGSHIYLDSPSSTSQITYKYQGKTGAQTFYAYVKNMIAMEILS